MPERSPASHEIRLICRLQPGSSGVDKLIEAMGVAGYTIEGNGIFGGSLKAELKATSLSGDEAMILIKSASQNDLKNLLNLLTRECWYVDIYYHLRGESAWAAARNLGLQLPENGVHRMSLRISGVDLRVDAYPRHNALTISYRAGWREANSGAVMKIHEKILGTGGDKGIIGRLAGWIK